MQRSVIRSICASTAGYLIILSVLFLPQFSKTSYGADMDTGKKVFESRCAICHGAKGDGNGVIGIVEKGVVGDKLWSVYPRDLTVGTFKFRSTPSGCLPTQADLEYIVSKGIMRAAMPSHKDVSKSDVDAVIVYVKSLSTRWQEEQPCKTFTAAKPKWVGSADSVKKGQEVYDKMKCWECHGKEGKGDGPKSNEIKDDFGKPILPFNFTTGELKRGSSPENVYMTFTTGLDGTGMPSYEDSLNEEQRWNLVSYTLKLMKK
ncbi:c-type cytochrome [Candidatus Magnetomonas plexicatena]|uniref:c-type cytochrome n=1 Tax=Candidatus Magnetomonas plexicatena TaxID=2552947 RepID=UPI001C75B9CE|nr:c-type cytochrome [Nitrospirales bacterium LBB_01]